MIAIVFLVYFCWWLGLSIGVGRSGCGRVDVYIKSPVCCRQSTVQQPTDNSRELALNCYILSHMMSCDSTWFRCVVRLFIVMLSSKTLCSVHVIKWCTNSDLWATSGPQTVVIQPVM